MDGLARSALYYYHQDNDYVIPVVWSTWDGQESPGAVERWQNFYAGTTSPVAHINGSHMYEEWDCIMENYQIAYDDVIDNESPLEIDLSMQLNRAHTFDLTAEVMVTEDILSGSNKIFFLITNWVEYSTQEPWFFLVVAKSDEYEMELTSLGETATYSATLSVTMQPGWSVDDLKAIAVVQSFETRQILQAVQTQYSGTPAQNELIAAEVTLQQNYPNPFNPSTNIAFSLAAESHVNINIFNQKGQKIKQLVNAQYAAGSHAAVWQGTDDSGQPVPSGIYFYKIHADVPGGGKYTSVKKMILLK